MAKPRVKNTGAEEELPPEIADADVSAKPEQGSAATTRIPEASSKAPSAPSEGSAS